MNNDVVPLPSFRTAPLKIRLIETSGDATDGSGAAEILIDVDGQWRRIATIALDQDLAATDLSPCQVRLSSHRCSQDRETLLVQTQGDGWARRSTITCRQVDAALVGQHAYTFERQQDLSLGLVLYLPLDDTVTYTYPLHAYEQAPAKVQPVHADVRWALPLPLHIWGTNEWVAVYGPLRETSGGTLDYLFREASGARVAISLPDTTVQSETMELYRGSARPTTMPCDPADEIVITDTLAAVKIPSQRIALYEASRLGAALFLNEPRQARNLDGVADSIAGFFERCDLWDPEALGPGRGWFRNMWVRTQSDKARRIGDFSGQYDLGWGEGYGVRIIAALARHWKRTGNLQLLDYAAQMTRNIDCFRRSNKPDDGYFDRWYCSDSDATDTTGRTRLSDFMGAPRIWAHSLGHVGFELADLYRDVLELPDHQMRSQWLASAESIGRFFRQRQSSNGDLPDGFGQNDEEVNRKRHRIPARAVVCGLWSHLGMIHGDDTWIDHAMRLARATASEIHQYEFYNQMVDTHPPNASPTDSIEIIDAENAIYALQGFVTLYDATREAQILELCQCCAAYIFSWTYHYDLPTGYQGITRGGVTCRMPDFPLLFPGANAMAIPPLMRLYGLTDDDHYRRMATEMLVCLIHYQCKAPGHPWHQGMIHAFDQHHGLHWGPDRQGQVDSGMTTAGSLSTLEFWIERYGTCATTDVR